MKGIICVVENTYGQVFTYKINGKDAAFMGYEDLHNSRFDHMEISASYSSFAGLSSKGGSYVGVPIDDSATAYKIRVYPSSELEGMYTSTAPIIFVSSPN